jgi:hypothetical protein
MTLAFHTIWLGGCPPLRTLEHLTHLLALSPPEAPGPLLWLDDSAWQALHQKPPLPLIPCGLEQVSAPLRQATASLFSPRPLPRQWLRWEQPGGPRRLPVLLLESYRPELERPWGDLQPALATLASLGGSASGGNAAGPFSTGRHLLEQELAFADPASAALLQPTTLLAYLHTLIDHARTRWAAHGLLCLASDLQRLLALAWMPGAYGDLGDVVGRLRRLPQAADAGLGGFCAHHTVAIENDLILSTTPLPLQAVVLATALWSWRQVRAIAGRLGIEQPGTNPVHQLEAVLPHLDRRLPRPPELAPLLQPPWTHLADYINVAYGAAALFHPPSQLSPFIAGRQGKELLINEVGGFTGYQKAAFHLAPGNAADWEHCAASLGLVDYAPQLGWKTYGFGTIDRLIDLGRRLEGDPAPSSTPPGLATPGSAAIAADLALVAESLGCPAMALERLALLCARLHALLSRAQHQPQQRHHWLAEVEKLCATTPAAP